MVKLLGIVTLILVLVLAPPAVLAVVSNNAVPGDNTYPIKRGLEDAIYAVASLNPSTKALFAKARSDRRFQEITTLFTQGKEASKTLNELVEQTQTAADQIDNVSDANEKRRLISQLSESINKYDEGLSRASQKRQQVVPSAKPTPRPSAVPVVTPQPVPSNQEEIDRIRRELEEIRKELEQARQNQISLQNQIQNQNQVQNSTPAPTPKPSPTPTKTINQNSYADTTANITGEEGGVPKSAGDLLRLRQVQTASGSSLETTPVPTASSSGSVQGASASIGIFSQLFLKLQSLFNFN